MFYYVYILQSELDSSLYIGFTTDLRKRVQDHNLGKSLATRPFRPYHLIFYEAFISRKDAKDREKYLKGGYGRRTINSMMGDFLKKQVGSPEADSGPCPDGKGKH